MNIWIVAAHDHVFRVDTSDRALRYTSLTEELLLRGHSVVLWTSSFHHGRKQQRSFIDSRVNPQPGYIVEFLNGRSYRKNVSFARISHNRQIAAEFRRRAPLNSLKPDLILASIPCLELAQAAAAFATARKCPLMVDVVDIWPEVYLLPFPRWTHFLLRGLLRSEFRRARYVLSSSTEIISISKEYLTWASQIARRANYDKNIFYLGYPSASPLDLEQAETRAGALRTRFGISEGVDIAAFVGTFGRTYDIETVTRAAREMAGVQSLHFFLAGAGDKHAAAQRYSGDLRNVTLSGWLNYKDTLSLLVTAKLGLSTYAPGAPQSLPYKPFEYMSLGLPQVCSLRGEFRDVLERYQLGYWYESGNYVSLRQGIETILSDSSSKERRDRVLDIYRRYFDSRSITAALATRLEQAVARA